MSPHTTVRYDMAVADDASTSRSAAVKATPPPYAKHPALHPNSLVCLNLLTQLLCGD